MGGELAWYTRPISKTLSSVVCRISLAKVWEEKKQKVKCTKEKRFGNNKYCLKGGAELFHSDGTIDSCEVGSLVKNLK